MQNSGHQKKVDRESGDTIGTERDWTQTDRARRKRIVTSAFVDRDATDRIRRAVDEVRAHRLVGAEPTCILLTGDPGVGKTSFLQHYEAMSPLQRINGCIVRPVLYVVFQAQTTPVGAAKTILRKLFLPQLGQVKDSNLTVDQELQLDRLCRGTQTELTFRVKAQLEAQKVEVVLNDEFQHVAEKGSDKSISKAADWVKEVVKDKNVPFLMAGISTVSRLVEQNAQLHDITRYRFDLSRFNYETEVQKLAFREFLAKLDISFPFNNPCRFADPELALSIFLITQGSLRQLATFLRHAAFAAIDRDSSCMTLDDLAAGFDAVESLSPLKQNPFKNGGFSTYAGRG